MGVKTRLPAPAAFLWEMAKRCWDATLMQHMCDNARDAIPKQNTGLSGRARPLPVGNQREITKQIPGDARTGLLAVPVRSANLSRFRQEPVQVIKICKTNAAANHRSDARSGFAIASRKAFGALENALKGFT